MSDARLREPHARSLPELSLSAFFERRWPSVYEALQDGRINTERLREQPSSWVGILEQRRMGTAQAAIEVGIEQLRALLPLMAGRRVILLADRWYASARFVQACRELGVGALIRLKCNRKLYRAAPPRTPKQRGAPCTHGPLFQGTRPETYGPADAEWEGVDEHGKRVVVSCWTGLHFRETPEQLELWSWIVACACNQLLLCQHLGQAVLRPWESKARAATPRQVRRVMPSILVQVGTPARRPKPRGKSPGWPKGRVRTPAPRFAVVLKPKPVPKTH